MGFESVTILIFATDESDSLIKTVQGILLTCDTKDIEKIIIIHSKNATASCLLAISRLKKEYPKMVNSLEQSHPFLGGAVSDAKQIVQSSHVILFSADLSISLSSVPAMINEEKTFSDGIVKTSRWLKKDSFHTYSSTRKIFNKIAQSFLRVLFHSSLTDLTNPGQIMPSEIFKSVCWKEKKAAIMLELVLVPLRLGIPFKEISTECYGRTEGKSKNSFFQTLLYFRTALRIRFSKPDEL